MSQNLNKFVVKKISGHGRGKELGIPTINMEIPNNLQLPYGVYAGWIVVKGKKYQSAIHFGPRPTFNETEPSLEAYILDGNIKNVPNVLELILIQFIRGVETFYFTSEKEMLTRIDQDIKEINTILSIDN